MIHKKLKLTVIFMMILTLLLGCGSQAPADFKAEGGAPLEDSVLPNSSGSASSSTGSVLPQNRKLIRRINIEAQTKEIDSLLPELEAHISTLGGYIENREIYSSSNESSHWRTARLTIRIPSDQADAFLASVDSKTNVLSLNENLTDVTLDYVATESRINVLKAEEARLLQMMDEAATLTEVLEVERRLTEVIADLEAVESQLRLYDNMIDYTTISLSVRQVTELSTPEDEMTIWERISTGFMSTLTDLGDTLVDLFVWLIVSSPVLVLLGAVSFCVLKLIQFIRKRKEKKQADKPVQ